MFSFDLTVIALLCPESWGSLCSCFSLLLTWTLGIDLFPSTGTWASQVIWVGPHEAVASWRCRALRKWSGSQTGNPGQDGAGQLEGRAELGWAVSQTTWKVLSSEVRGRELGGLPCLVSETEMVVSACLLHYLCLHREELMVWSWPCWHFLISERKGMLPEIQGLGSKNQAHCSEQLLRPSYVTYMGHSVPVTKKVDLTKVLHLPGDKNLLLRLLR